MKKFHGLFYAVRNSQITESRLKIITESPQHRGRPRRVRDNSERVCTVRSIRLRSVLEFSSVEYKSCHSLMEFHLKFDSRTLD